MTKPTGKAGMIAGALVLLAIICAYNWDVISRSHAYLTLFHDDQLQRMHRAWKARHDAIDALDHQECRIEMKAVADVMAIEIRRDVLMGMDEQGVRDRAQREYQIDNQLCDSLGISPFIQKETQ